MRFQSLAVIIAISLSLEALTATAQPLLEPILPPLQRLEPQIEPVITPNDEPTIPRTLGDAIDLVEVAEAKQQIDLVEVAEAKQQIPRVMPKIVEEISDQQPIAVDRTIDGDTIVATTTDGTKIHIRLCGVDAPEKAQPLGPVATSALAAILAGKQVSAIFTATDIYGRSIGTLYADGLSVQAQMAKKGMALYYSAYAKNCPDREAIVESENSARTNRLGVWGDSHFTPPWTFRANKKAPQRQSKVKPIVNSQPKQKAM